MADDAWLIMSSKVIGIESESFKLSTLVLGSDDEETDSSTEVSLIIRPQHDWRLVATDRENAGLEENDDTLPAAARTKKRAAALIFKTMIIFFKQYKSCTGNRNHVNSFSPVLRLLCSNIEDDDDDGVVFHSGRGDATALFHKR